MKNIIQRVEVSKLRFLIFSLIIVATSCKKDGSKTESNDNGLGLNLASASEIQGTPTTPEFLVGSLPSSSILDMPPIGNQGRQGSCVAWATAYAGMSFFMNRSNGTHYNSTQELCSPKFLYNQIKYSSDCNSGSTFPTAFKLLQSKGVCTLNDMPYSETECSSQPNTTQNNNALNNRIFSWRMVDKNNTNVVKSCIAAKYPVFIAINIDESFKNLRSPYIWTAKYGNSSGGHAVTVVGYDDTKGAFKVQNSWGSNYQDSGHFWISYSFFSQAVIGSECYIAFPIVTSPNDNINSGLVVNMPFNGNANDVSGNNNNGVISGVTLTSDSKGNSNSAYKFNGYSSPSSITISSSPSLNNLTAYSICFWVKLDSHAGDNGTGNVAADGNSQTSFQTILYKGGNTLAQYNAGYRFLLSSQANIFGVYLGSGGGGQTSGAYSKINEWHYYVFSKSGNVLKMFKDGILIWDLQSSFANLSDVNGFNLMLGKSSIAGSGIPFNGVLDEFRIYNRALTQSEVQKLYKL